MEEIRGVLITAPNQSVEIETIHALRESGYDGFIGVSVAHDDDANELYEAGANAALWNLQ